MDVGEVLAVLYGPPLLLLLSAVSVLQLNFLVQALSAFAKSRGTTALWKAVQPALLQLTKTLDGAFRGSGKLFEPNANHLLLFALLLAVLVTGERLHAALKRIQPPPNVTSAGRVNKG
jgi:hypothetical protein